jgi:hypothetical protein
MVLRHRGPWPARFREDAARAEALAASTPLHGALQEKVASTDNGNRNDHEALRRRPTMWR